MNVHFHRRLDSHHPKYDRLSDLTVRKSSSWVKGRSSSSTTSRKRGVFTPDLSPLSGKRVDEKCGGFVTQLDFRSTRGYRVREEGGRDN